MKKVALITGIYGQDGSYLAELLVREGYEVHGTTRDATTRPWRHEYLGITENVTIHENPLTHLDSVTSLLSTVQPHEIYHLAAQGSVGTSIARPCETVYDNITNTLHLLEAVRLTNQSIRFFNASSSDIFADGAPQPLTPDSSIYPTTPYGTSKATAHLLTQNYRTLFNLYAVNGILFPHESPLRRNDSFVKKLVSAALRIQHGAPETITVGAVSNQRDYGDAQNFVKAIWLSLQPEKPDDYIIGTGTPTTMQHIVDYVLAACNLPATITRVDESLLQRAPQPIIYGDPSLTIAALGWLPEGTIYDTIDAMIAYEKPLINTIT